MPNPATLRQLPVFALPSTVLFPGTVLPLHIFEPRYRRMVADVLAGDASLALVMQRSDGPPGDEPLLHEVGCLGRIIHADELEGGRYNILLQGSHRVRLLEELPREKPYRRFRANIIERPSGRDLGCAAQELGRLQSCVLSLRQSLETRDEQLCEVLRSTSDPIQLADVLAAAVVSDCDLQQHLLACESFAERVRALIDALADVMVRTGEPPKEARMN